MLLNGHQLTF